MNNLETMNEPDRINYAYGGVRAPRIYPRFQRNRRRYGSRRVEHAENKDDEYHPVISHVKTKNNIPKTLKEMKDEKTEEDACVVCMENKRVVALLPCGHKYTCASCTLQLYEDGSQCPNCRKEFTDVLRVYD